MQRQHRIGPSRFLYGALVGLVSCWCLYTRVQFPDWLAHFLWLLMPAALVLGLPILTIWVLRQQALQASEDQLATIRLQHLRQLNGITLSLWLGWIGVSFTTEMRHFRLSIAAPNLLHTALEAGLFIVPPMIAMVSCHLLSHKVVAYPGKANLNQTVAAKSKFIWLLIDQLQAALPLACFFSGCRLFFIHQLFQATILLVTAWGSQMILSQFKLKSDDSATQALIEGELRDRIFALAQRAEVRLHQIYVLPIGQDHRINAFAIQGGRLMLTETLLHYLSKREVDAILAHEVAHLQYKHPQLLQALLIAASSVIVGGIFTLSIWQSSLLLLPIAAVCMLAVYYGCCRRFEYQADRQAVRLTNDPGALMTGLLKLAQINKMPLSWGKYEGLLMTHPSMSQRIKALVRRYGMHSCQIQQAGQMIQTADFYILPKIAHHPSEFI